MYFLILYYADEDGGHFEMIKARSTIDIEDKIAEIMDPESYSFNNERAVDQDTKRLIVIEGKQLKYKAVEKVTKWEVVE